MVASLTAWKLILKPNVKLAETTTRNGGNLVLYEHDGQFCIRLNGQELMHSAVTASESLLGEVATERLSGTEAHRVLIGGLGLGFTLKGVLGGIGRAAQVEVAELFPAVVEWNRTFLAHLNGKLLSDPRVKVLTEDVANVLQRAEPECYDAILIDTDNGPTPMVQSQNVRLYSHRGLEQISKVLKPDGRAAFWSARPDRAFEHRLTQVGFTVRAVPAKLYPNAKRFACTLYAADKR